MFLLTKEFSLSYPFQLGHLLEKLVADLARDFSSTECFQMKKKKTAKESLCFVVLYQALKKKADFSSGRFLWFSKGSLGSPQLSTGQAIKDIFLLVSLLSPIVCLPTAVVCSDNAE